jgi:hypothetical protein
MNLGEMEGGSQEHSRLHPTYFKYVSPVIGGSLASIVLTQVEGDGDQHPAVDD